MRRYFIALFSLLALALPLLPLSITANTPHPVFAQDDGFCAEFPDDPDCQDDGDDDGAGTADTDGDGVVVPFDRCPERGGPANLDGCPPQYDEDDDGIQNDRDGCLFEAGPASNDGCPVDDAPDGTPEPEQDPQLPELPTDTNDCIVAPSGAFEVNVREQPGEGTAVVGVLDPTTTYTASRQSEDGEWLFVEGLGGWVAARVIRTNGNCDLTTTSAPAASPTPQVTFLEIQTTVNGLPAPNPPGYQTTPGSDLDWLHAVWVRGNTEAEVTQVVGANGTDVSANCKPNLPVTLQPSSSPQIFCLQSTTAQRGLKLRESIVRGTGQQTSLFSNTFTYYEALRLEEDPIAQLQINTTVDGNPAPLPPGYTTTPGASLNWVHTVTNVGGADAEVDVVVGANGTDVSSNCTPALPTVLPASGSAQVQCNQTTSAQQGQNLRQSVAAGDAMRSGRRLIDVDYTNYIAQGDGNGQPGDINPPNELSVARANVLAVFEVYEPEEDQTDVYLLTNNGAEPLAADPELNENAPALSPTGDRAAYLKTNADDITQVLVRNLNDDTVTPVLRENETIEIANWAPTWTPDGNNVLVTLIADDGSSEVHRIAADGSTSQLPELVIENARQPVFAQSGESIAFVRGSDVHTYTVETGETTSITDPADRTTCAAPVYSPGAQALYFTCESELFRNTDNGASPVEITGAEIVENPQFGAGLNAYLFDDGTDIYIGTTAPTDATPLVDFANRDAYRIHTPYAN